MSDKQASEILQFIGCLRDDLSVVSDEYMSSHISDYLSRDEYYLSKYLDRRALHVKNPDMVDVIDSILTRILSCVVSVRDKEDEKDLHQKD